MSNPTIVAIATTVPSGKIKYVETIDRRSVDKRYTVTLTDDPEYAHDFEEESLAGIVIPAIVNPYDRIYEIRKLASEKISRISVNSQGDLK